MDPRAVLSHPAVYKAWRSLVGGHRVRVECVQRYVRPFSGARVLDCGCGPGDLLDYLPAVEYVGIDIEDRYIKAARESYGDRAEFRLGPVGPETVVETEHFDLVVAWGLMHHLSDDQLAEFLSCARRALKRGGRFVSFDGCYHPNQSAIARWLLDRDRGRHVRDLEVWREILEGVFPQVELHLRQDLLRIPYSHLIVVARPGDSGST